MSEYQYVNYYRCPDDGAVWAMAWSCMCDDRCPKCNHEIEPYKSETQADGEGGRLVPGSESPER